MGLRMGVAIGTVTGMGAAIKNSLDNKISPWTGKPLEPVKELPSGLSDMDRGVIDIDNLNDHPSLNSKTGPNHNFSRELQIETIQKGNPSMSTKHPGDYFYELPKGEGVYQIGVKTDGMIWHRNMVPYTNFPKTFHFQNDISRFVVPRIFP
jgi:hypothetical protein